MSSIGQRYAITMFDDIQRHQKGCECGHCERLTGRSFGVSIRACEACAGGFVDVDLVEKALVVDDVIDRVYAPSAREARAAAKIKTEQLGYKFLGDI
ncbi:hypothetical protein FY034_17680 (plasmid) [Trichlorobacter lovleyi]|uniref:hypothetical protein n=1 Tax=Trichlorobacter lovleyi TaxID=313985 RepID=UPI0022408E30|nr:hypothetical protein [Trichlorobacter lovleyi]QOX80855.1 hypothetical protein FY034_17680 [Trichlorobacter lovleyi]